MARASIGWVGIWVGPRELTQCINWIQIQMPLCFRPQYQTPLLLGSLSVREGTFYLYTHTISWVVSSGSLCCSYVYTFSQFRLFCLFLYVFGVLEVGGIYRTTWYLGLPSGINTMYKLSLSPNAAFRAIRIPISPLDVFTP